MSNSGIKSVVVAAVASLVVAACMAGEATTPKLQTVTVKGVVAVTWDEDWNPTAVTVKDATKRPAVVYQVTLDAKGIDLANELEDAEAEIVAVLTEDKAKKTKTLKVKSFKAVQVEEPEPEEAPEDEGGWEPPADDEGEAEW